MRKINFLLVLLLFLAVSTRAELTNVGIEKYAVLEVSQNNTPLREKADESAYRLSHLYKDAILFADKQNDKYYRVELDKNNYAWINKKFVEVQAIIPEKRFENIKKIHFKETKNLYTAKIETPLKSAFLFNENNKNLGFSLFDNRFDPIETKVSNRNGIFKLPDTIVNSLFLNYSNNRPLFGYNLEDFEKGYILKVKKAPRINKTRPLKNIRIVVDPGHGGVEKGACAFGLEEKNINLQISKKLKRELQRRGAKVYLTRSRDKKVPLYDRPLFALSKNADIMISIHQNALPNPKDIDKKYGTGTYYYHAQAKPLAASIQKNMLLSTGFRDDGVNFASFVLTRPTMPVSVLVECGYIIRKEEADKISDPKFQDVIARAIARGTEDYMLENFSL